jgi:hypothetical protein
MLSFFTMGIFIKYPHNIGQKRRALALMIDGDIRQVRVYYMGIIFKYPHNDAL